MTITMREQENGTWLYAQPFVRLLKTPRHQVKKKTLEHPKACPIKRAAYQSKLDNFKQQGYPIVYMDEESDLKSQPIRPHGYVTDFPQTLYRQLQLAR